MKDSMRAQLLLCENYLNTRDLQKATELYHKYDSTNDKFVFDEFKIWEKGEYYDIYSRLLFLKKQYHDLEYFILNKIGYNKKIDVKNESEFYKLVSSYYLRYYNDTNSNNFKLFYNKNFR